MRRHGVGAFLTQSIPFHLLPFLSHKARGKAGRGIRRGAPGSFGSNGDLVNFCLWNFRECRQPYDEYRRRSDAMTAIKMEQPDHV